MNKIIWFVSQDQGSADALAPVIKKITKRDNTNIEVFAAKFSKKIFQNLDIDFADLGDKGIENPVDFKPDLIVTGASMRKSIEKEAISYALQHNIRSITLLDYWGNYWQRFTVQGQRDPDSLPGLILVPDQNAKKQMIIEGFPEERLAVTGNPYFDTFSILKKKKPDHVTKTVLFISQPIYKNGRYLTDIVKIQDVVKTFLETKQSVNLIIKPHPKEDLIYVKNLRKLRNIEVQSEKDTKSLINEADIIIGTDSTALFESVFSGRPVISYQPEKGRKDNLVTNKMGLSHLAESRDELSATIQKIMNGELLAKTIPGVKYFNDGKCAERVVKKIEQFLL